MRKHLLIPLALICMMTACSINETNNVFLQDITCEYLNEPLGIDVAQPRFAWKMAQTSEASSGQLQTAYQILVASSPDKLLAGEGDLWNSGIVRSAQSIQVPYAGTPLQSMQQCWWKVRVWNNHREVTAWSKPARFGVGILNASDWQAQWIGDQPDVKLRQYVEYVDAHYDMGKGYDAKIAENPPLLPSPLLRKSFTVDKPVNNALLYVSALGYYEMSLNGERVGDHQLAPEWTDYYERVQYQVYDLTKQVRAGSNALAAILADGWCLGELGPVRWIGAYAFPFRGFYGLDRRLIAQLKIEYEDGSTQIIATDDTWKINPDGHVRTADNFVGQTIDARKIIPGWDAPDFDDSRWANACIDKDVNRNLEAQKNEPVRIHRELRPVGIQPWKDKYIVNFGQNIAGWCALKIKGKPGQVITLRHGEWLNDDGSIYTVGLGRAKETDVFILSGNEDSFEPRFTYHGFQYVEISGLEQALTPDMITAKAVSSDPEITGSFECSNPKLNQLFSNILWTQRNNMHSIPTDCPQRDERCGWLGDAQVFSQNSIFNMNMAGFFTKFVKDMRDAVAPNGHFYGIVPSVRHGNLGLAMQHWFGAGWSDAGVIIPWRVYENYGDTRILTEHYEAMKRYIESIYSDNPDYIRKNNVGQNWNDWLNANTFSDPPEEYDTTRGAMPNEVFNTAFFAHSVHILSQAAAIIGNKDDAARYSDMQNKINAAFVKEFVDMDGKVAGDVQGAYAIALHYDMLPDSLQAKAIGHLIRCIEEYDYRISTGFITTPMMMRELARRGHTDIAYRLLESERFPSWIYAINQGATTVWERWDAYVKGRGIHPSTMNSFDHYSIGSVGEWIYRNVLGINPDEVRPGYEHFVIQPRPGGTLTYAKGSYNSIRGEISVDWKIADGSFILNVNIPANTTATVILPDGKARKTGSGNHVFKTKL
jgi:alpha-L-rhamnosidase